MQKDNKIQNIHLNFEQHISLFLDKKRVDSIIGELGNKEISSFRINKLKIKNIDDIFDDSSSFSPYNLVDNAFYYDKEDDFLGKSIIFNAGGIYIQDPAAMLTYKFLDIKENDIVLDMCAAPGGKTFNILNDLKGTGLLFSCDLSEKRAEILSSNVEKYGFNNAIVFCGDSNLYKDNFRCFFDKIVLDAPCSGSFMFRKNDESYNDWTIEKVIKCSIIQKELIENAYFMLKPGGKLVYSTCSISKEENEDVITDFLAKHSDMKLVNIDLNSIYDDSIGILGGLRLYPDKFKGEGQVIFLLEKEFMEYQSSKLKEITSNSIHKDVIKFLNDIKFKYSNKDIININDRYYYCSFPKYKINNVKIKRYGLYLGEVTKDRFVPSHSLAMYYGIDESVKIELTYNEAIDYYKGYSIPKDGNGSYKIVTYKGLNLGWVKHSNNLLKNHLPSGLKQFGVK